MSTRLGLAVVIGALAFGTTTAAAQVVPAFTQTNGYLIYPNGFEPSRDLHTGASPASSVSSLSASGGWGALSTYGFADLATGTLKSRTTLTNADPTNNLYVQSNAYFGDGFRAFANDNPFNWGPSAAGRFTLDLSGSISSSTSLSSLNAGAFVVLSVLKPGTLDVDGRLAGVPEVLQYYYWQIGNPNLFLQTCDYIGNCSPMTPSAYLTSFPTRIVQDVTPGSDFDWMLLIGSYGQPGDQLGSFDIDFSHTLTASYEGPQGTTTLSQSGLFPGTAPLTTTVPEPTTISLMAAGLLLVAVQHRRRRLIRATRVA